MPPKIPSRSDFLPPAEMDYESPVERYTGADCEPHEGHHKLASLIEQYSYKPKPG